jgi:putative transposase
MSMARHPRFFVPGVPQHIIQRGNNRARIFARIHDYRFFIDCLLKACRLHGVAVHAYVLMTNHVHILATPQGMDSLPKVFQSVGRRYVQYFNHVHDRTGTLWEGRYRAAAIDSERYFLTCMRYIELNPVRAGLARDPGRYPWSSYRANSKGALDSLITPHDLYDQLGRSPAERQAAYRHLFRAQMANADVEAIRGATNKNWALGGPAFAQWIESVSGRQAAPTRRCRSSFEARSGRESDPRPRV